MLENSIITYNSYNQAFIINGKSYDYCEMITSTIDTSEFENRVLKNRIALKIKHLENVLASTAT